ncbi:MAG: hypothetical protein AAF357_12180 [Verrucomicrobiota bacterium]
MTAHHITDWQFWNSIVCARLPIRLLLEPNRIAARPQMKEASASAYVHRMFDLFFFQLRDPAIIERFEEEERRDIRAFVSAFDSLPWRPLSSHPHISELESDDLSSLIPFVKKVDRRLWLRTGRGILPIVYRLFRGWPLFEAPLKQKEKEGLFLFHQTSCSW